MQQRPGFDCPVFREAAAVTVGSPEPVFSAKNRSTAPWLTHQLYPASLFHLGRAHSSLDDQLEEVPSVKREEDMHDFFGIEDLLAQAYEDAVYVQLIFT
jgi:hypothetical protein